MSYSSLFSSSSSSSPSTDISTCCVHPSTTIEFKIASNNNENNNNNNNRYAVAKRKLSKGQVILRNAPLAWSLHNITSSQVGSNTATSSSSSSSSRCSYCLATPTNTKTKLSRCGRCRCIYYCSRDCQKKDFPAHKIECSYFTSSSSSSIFGNNTINNDRVGVIIADICLLIRTYHSVVVSNRNNNSNNRTANCCKTTAVENASIDIVNCGKDHFFALAELSPSSSSSSSSEGLDSVDERIVQEATNAILLSVGKDKFQQQQQQVCEMMKKFLLKFRINNFGITDQLLNVIASGVYPLGALLNHSCNPNCILRYRYYNDENDNETTTTKTTTREKSRHPPVLEIVTCRNVQRGEELTHSYVELLDPVSRRQEQLLASYGFLCNCQRCFVEKQRRQQQQQKQQQNCHDDNTTGITTTTTPSNNNVSLLQQLEKSSKCRRQWLEYYNPCKEKEINQPSRILSSSSLKNDEKQQQQQQQLLLLPLLLLNLEQQREQSKYCFSSDNLQGELDALSKVVEILCQILLLSLTTKVVQGNGNTAGTSRIKREDDEEEQQLDQEKLGLDIYKARGDYLGTLIVANDIEQAIVQCEYIVLYLVSILNGDGGYGGCGGCGGCGGDDDGNNTTIECQNHPILGLQLFTLGDLYQSMMILQEEDDDNDDDELPNASYYKILAFDTYSWARQILTISHGKDSSMVLLLDEKLEIYTDNM